MTSVRIALGNLRYPATPAESVVLCEQAIAEAAARQADIICFPECFLPGYRAPGTPRPAADAVFLDAAWIRVADAARQGGVAVVLGTERLVADRLLATALVIDRCGVRLGFQDKVQLDVSEEPIYSPGTDRKLFRLGPLAFGIAICHEGWRYPETVRWAARQGATVVFHPHYHAAEPGSYQPSRFADPANTIHEKTMLCRAAENEVYFASVNFASAGSPTTSAVIRPDGSVLCHQAYGVEGLLVADLDLSAATGRLASRLKVIESAATLSSSIQ